jgi:ketosteroid isomerase-like protein
LAGFVCDIGGNLDGPISGAQIGARYPHFINPFNALPVKSNLLTRAHAAEPNAMGDTMKFISIIFATLICTSAALAAPADDIKAVAELDTRYQAAVKANDADGMAAILHDDFVLVIGDGRTISRADLIANARTRKVTYTHQEEEAGTQVVRVWGDTAVVTAKLWLAGSDGAGNKFDRKLWFSDTYVRTPQGWKYAFGQASLPLPGGN